MACLGRGDHSTAGFWQAAQRDIHEFFLVLCAGLPTCGVTFGSPAGGEPFGITVSFSSATLPAQGGMYYVYGFIYLLTPLSCMT